MPSWTHYPRLPGNLIISAVWPVPPDRPSFKTLPRLVESNIFTPSTVLAPHAEFTAYHSALDLSLFTGQVAADQPLEWGIWWSNDEVDASGDWITDKTLPDCHWDITEKRASYTPSKKGRDGVEADKFYFLPMGRWIKIWFKLGEVVPKEVRLYLRGKTF